MTTETLTDEKTGRKYTIDYPDDYRLGEAVTLLLSLHGGGSVGAWQRLYFPAQDVANKYRVVIVTPSCATKEPFRRWVLDADEEHLVNIIEQTFARFGKQNIKAFWLVGHSQGGMTSNLLLGTDYFRDRVDGWLSLSGGRLGPIKLPDTFFPGGRPPNLPATGPRPGAGTLPDADISFIFTSGEREMVELPATSPWAEKYGAGARVRQPDVIDDKPGQVWDTTREGKSTPAWGGRPAPGKAEVWLYPNAQGGKVIADVVRLEKGHTEGLEPNVTDYLVKLMVEAPGGKMRNL
ncbi:MAG TPA: alpha/beta hydrolase [Rhizomicrobium sp.]|jgi:pimeloyl-ACP methyl ester carboxylesterase